MKNKRESTRSTVERCISILEILRLHGAQPKIRLMYGADLAHSALKPLLTMLESAGLILVEKEYNGNIAITAVGMKTLDVYAQLKALLLGQVDNDTQN